MTVRSLILGLDVSPKRLGWGVCDLVTGEPVACGMQPIDLPSAGWAHQQAERALTFAVLAWDMASPGDHEVQAVYIERPALPRQSGTNGSFNAGRAVQAVHGEVERRWPWAPIQYLQPAEWRKLAGLAGNASKETVYLRACELVGEEVMPPDSRVMEWVVPGGQDAADALLVALAGWARNEDVIARAAEIEARR